MRIEENIKLDFKDVLIKPKRSTLTSRKEVILKRSFRFKHSQYTLSNIVPIIASNMDGVGTFSMASVLENYNCLTVIRKHYSLDDWKKKSYLVRSKIPTIGLSIDDINFLKNLSKFFEVTFVCIDVANGYQEDFVKFVKIVRREFPLIIIIAGNVATPEMTEQLILAGADIVKVGIGSGFVCTTRQTTGVGYPQLSAVIECADAAHGLGGYIISDGGCREIADISKAFCAGADFVMLGTMLAGYVESESKIDENGYITFYGMASIDAVEKYSERKDYQSIEGKKIRIKYKGSVKNAIQDILSGIRSTCTYIGARRIKDMSKCTTFIKI